MISRSRLVTAAIGLFAVCTLATAAPQAPAPSPAPSPLVEGTDYRQVVPAQNTASPDKIEVDEFFSYACPHCAAFFPVVNKWLAKQSADVVFRRVPISFERPQWVTLARAYYALQTSGDLPKLDGALFKAIHQDHEQLFDQGALTDWVGKNGGSAEKFAQAYGSFSVNNQTVQADRMAQDYGVDSVPMLAVDGRYVAMANPAAGEEAYGRELLVHTDALIAKARAEHAAAAKAAAKAPAKAPAKN